jgi:hypothetical protein
MSLAISFERLGINFGSLIFMHVNRNMVYVLALFMLIAVFPRNSNEMSQGFRPNWRHAVFTIVVAFYSLLNIHNVTEFIYFNF